MGFNSSIIAKRDMHQTTLVGTHRRKSNRPMLTHGTGGSRVGHRSNLIIATALITLDINHHRITEPQATAHNQREHRLQRLKRTTVTPDEYSQIGSSNIEDQLAVIALILIDRGIFGIKMLQNIANHRQRNISDGIKLLIGKFLARLIFARNLGILADDLIEGGRRDLILLDFKQFLRHDVSQNLFRYLIKYRFT